MNARSQSVADRLAAGPIRGLGEANAIAADALRSPEMLDALIAALADERPLAAMRAANALKRMRAQHPELLHPHARALLRAALDCQDLPTRWNLTLVLGGLPLKGRDRALAVELMFEALGSSSGFLRAFALTGLVNFAGDDPALEQRKQPLLQHALTDSSAAVRARARKLSPLLAARKH